VIRQQHFVGDIKTAAVTALTPPHPYPHKTPPAQKVRTQLTPTTPGHLAAHPPKAFRTGGRTAAESFARRPDKISAATAGPSNKHYTSTARPPKTGNTRQNHLYRRFVHLLSAASELRHLRAGKPCCERRLSQTSQQSHRHRKQSHYMIFRSPTPHPTPPPSHFTPPLPTPACLPERRSSTRVPRNCTQ